MRVQGSTSSEATAVVEAASVVVRGRLLDDAGRPIFGSGAHVRVRFKATREAPYARLPRPHGCDDTSSEKIRYAIDRPNLPDEYRIDPDDAFGTFCVRLPELGPTGVVELGYEGNAYYAGHTALIDFDKAARSLSLRFSPVPQRIALDRGSHIIGIDTNLEPPLLAEEAASPVQLELLFSDASNAPRSLGTSAVRPGERVQFEVLSRLLGEPGPGRFTVRFAGSPTIHGAEHSAIIQKVRRVSLSVAGAIEPADPHDGIEIKVAVGSAEGAVNSGLVEARVGKDSIGTAAVSAGAARVVTVFDAAHEGSVPVTLHYLPSSPWWEASEPLHVVVPVKSPSAWRRLPWVLVAIAIASWVATSWRRPGRLEPRKSAIDTAPSGRAALSVIERGRLRSGWHGRVIDAHDGWPIKSARVAIVTPAFGGDGVVRSATSDEHGNFALEHVEGAGVEGARMNISAPWHASLTRPIPEAGEIVVSLVSRRRALVERLVEWSNFRGRPWKQGGEATPGHVATIARARRTHDIAAWASAVEEAAYGPDPLDERGERQVQAIEPDWGGAKPVLHKIPKRGG